ncbi:polysaccharide pyruvyl transferase family protein [Psychroflexus sp. CAK8W]|uniref:Polysaccharide pyruvyl transferase family protein n=1 Tax=Psychroflexus longus TaxID=2873596 RepID=A0ABS7XFH2_9FLAO|nr:polysaccharide pyruvyl transferase family protein [Psychroflexus longus]MBZ9777712.1 polysaccharide pyruvyl transferase family protein [Psychroflexus longus]
MIKFRLKANRKIESIIDRFRSIRNIIKHDITIIGSYNTSNAGDKILCDAASHFFLEKGYKVNIQSKRKIISFKSNYVIVCGGDILHDNNKNNIKWLSKLLSLNEKVVFLGVGVPGFYLTSDKVVFELLNKASLIITRDSKSFLRLKKFNLENIFNGVDNAFLIKELLSKDVQSYNDEVILNIKEINSAILANEWLKKKGNVPVEKSNYLKFINLLINYYRSKGITKISALPMTIDDEVFIKEYFIDKVDYIYEYTSNFYKISSIISKAKEVFATRYHFHLLSLINKKSIICFAYADKVENINDEINNFKYISNKDVKFYNTINFESHINKYAEYRDGFESYMTKLHKEIELLNELN